ncbi:unnamed protein product [Tuber melanosporum]|uniref:(Perigord truffle) hypothetical protein n=1 Tax=Tuber melanosporum (strain Mel28) TaxID=656061 RepID=D5G4T3_TUBMM|nr:uncharacterized protein GSTUM_00000182001 [Tuber melanosporum]CAZ79526.1 unnamed protein product [Tuber melanosporum]
MQRPKSPVHYQTFPTTPPASRGAHVGGNSGPPESSLESPSDDRSSVSKASAGTSGKAGGGRGNSDDIQSTIPKKQLLTLAIISLAEQTALNSISPYLPEMTGAFPEVDQRRVGLYVGIVASSFATAQFATNFFWGRLSDRIGRKPVILFGTLATAACFMAFGFCRTLWQAIVVQAIMGLVNGNAGIVSTILGEITDKSNQPSTFKYLPVMYGIGGITGPLIGGVLAHPVTSEPSGPITKLFGKNPYLLPNAVSAGVLLLDLLFATFLLDESLQEARKLPPLGERVKNLFVWLWEFTSSSRPSYIRVSQSHRDESDDEGEGAQDSPPHPTDCSGLPSPPPLFPEATAPVPYSSILTPPIIVFLITYAIFNLSNTSYNSLYPIFLSSPPPTGRGLSPKELGLSLSFAGVVTIIFELLLFGPLQSHLGNLWGYRFALAGFVAAFCATPFVGYIDPANERSTKAWLWIELCSILLLKTVAAVVGLTCALLLITNASPKSSTLGTLNGLAQTLNAGGRAIGPLISGGLFTLGAGLPNRGELLAWGVFGGVSGIGLGLSLRGVGGERSLDGEGGEEGNFEGGAEMQ